MGKHHKCRHNWCHLGKDHEFSSRQTRHTHERVLHEHCDSSCGACDRNRSDARPRSRDRRHARYAVVPPPDGYTYAGPLPESTSWSSSSSVGDGSLVVDSSATESSSDEVQTWAMALRDDVDGILPQLDSTMEDHDSFFQAAVEAGGVNLVLSLVVLAGRSWSNHDEPDPPLHDRARVCGGYSNLDPTNHVSLNQPAPRPRSSVYRERRGSSYSWLVCADDDLVDDYFNLFRHTAYDEMIKNFTLVRFIISAVVNRHDRRENNTQKMLSVFAWAKGAFALSLPSCSLSIIRVHQIRFCECVISLVSACHHRRHYVSGKKWLNVVLDRCGHAQFNYSPMVTFRSQIRQFYSCIWKTIFQCTWFVSYARNCDSFRTYC